MSGEEVTQTTSEAKAHLVGSVGASGPLTMGLVVGASNTLATKKWTGTANGAVCTEAAISVQPTKVVPVTLNAGSAPQVCNDGHN